MLKLVVVEIGEVATRARLRNKEGKYARTMPRIFGNRFNLLNLQVFVGWDWLLIIELMLS